VKVGEGFTVIAGPCTVESEKQTIETAIAAPLLGSPFTFASLTRGRQAAEGQIDGETLQGLLEDLGAGGVERP
jgi:3-deoxy-D-arabino-heptulosonate 7-phosphate (DAHP) synthase